MLTHHDQTVMNARELFEACKGSAASCWGFKEHPLPHDQMQQLFGEMKACGKSTFLEVVAYSEEEGLAGAQMAVTCGCDVLMGTKYFDSINDYCRAHHLKYMPFVGELVGRPTVLGGTIDDMIGEAQEYLRKGVYGIDLLAYRYTGDSNDLICRFLKEVPAPVCIAGSVDSMERLDEMKEVSPWAFTIGSAFFENKFGDSFCRQIDFVCDYIDQ